ncbi:carbohydrate ABC transporter membrane protein 1, CUT1 family (TC 3.A.1.1.-) [Halogranum amylolyticum]|uniref:Carbohydrate ABC transporter membrane protein 1, CUT1 family (TC 3.A.1.1.-) n=1 Tax=Halogranum amylolyticum TaxID=660520 RepID=A0A1H8VN03_9EURY|nr:sugar ABC transporter permease [Halogranum amylolyticum]SEP16683.1 carbohydrate ABC transporter membrane protein 1, CUT1 family (TC 3.A.1.1.-) [Halogranum amylolyticum]
MSNVETVADAGTASRWEQLFDRSTRELLVGLLFAAPYLALFTVFLLYPLLKGLYMSLHEWNFLEPSKSTFVGLENYARLLNDPAFWNALWNTLEFVGMTVPLIVGLSLVLALGLNQELKGSRILQFIYFSPYVLTVAVVGIVWAQMFAQSGVGTQYFSWLFSGSPLNSKFWAMPVIVITTVWWQAGFYFAVLLASRQNVPERLYEAARLDGAGPWRMFRDVTLPHMKNGLLFVVIASTIFQFQVFGQPYLMTKGGPVGNTETLVYYLYQLGFQTRELGFGSAVGYTLLLILIGVSALNYVIVGTNDE